MNRYQQTVQDFHHTFKQPVSDKPGFGSGFSTKLRVHLIEEEAREVCDAMKKGLPIDIVDGLCDLLYVTYGTAVAAQVDLDPYFEEVHRSNMAKLGPKGKPLFRPDLPGRIIKPPGWTPPDLRSIAIADGIIEVDDD